MYSRREILAGAIGAAGAAALARPFGTVLASAPEPRTAVSFKVPAGACDCHTHIFDPGEFPYAASRPYTPETASIADVRALHRALHIDRVVISQPTVYGTDHTCTLNAIKQLGRNARGVAAFAPDTSSEELDRLHRGGMRGLVVHKMSDFKDAAAQIGDRPWNIETYVRLPQMEAFRDQVMASKVAVKLTLFGGAQNAGDVHQPGFGILLDLLRSGRVYVELSTPSHISSQAPDYADAAPIPKALIAANPQRITWGSDWPHAATVPGRQMTGVVPFEQIDDAVSLNSLATWVSGADQLKLILVENAARLYGF
jgi:predicted TIM-barrel fold metal-dependent hydrolase